MTGMDSIGAAALQLLSRRSLPTAIMLASACGSLGLITVPAHATNYSDSFSSDPNSFGCGYYSNSLICGNGGALSGGARYLNAGDHVTVHVDFTSPVHVPGSDTGNVVYVLLPDSRYVGGAALPGPNAATVTTTMSGYAGPLNPYTTYRGSTLNGYVASGGFCCGYGVPNAGYSLTGVTAEFDILTSDLYPVASDYWGYSVTLPATPEVLSSFPGGTAGHPAILPSGLVGEISSNISGGTAPSEQFYMFNWDGGFLQTKGSIVDANPLADFHFELVNPYTLDVITDAILNQDNNFAWTLSQALDPGQYEIGMYTDSPYDPQFTIHFNTPIQGIPEPGTWAMLVTGFGLTGVALRRRFSIAHLFPA
jgi:hypothetical protein